MSKFHANITRLVSSSLLALLIATPAWSQTPTDQTEPLEDEVVVEGTQTSSNHEGMDAFFRGDFETAEIEFEQEFKSLRRFRSAQENAAFDADVSADRAAAVGEFGANTGSAANNRNGVTPTEFSGSGLNTSSALSTNFVNRRSEGQNVLTDGKVTFEDFAFTRYMTGLSEIKLGKYDEALESLKSSIHYDKGNYDARMRLGMLYLMERDYERAADQLEKLDEMRRRCNKIDCDDKEPIREATVTLADQITDAIEASN